MGQKMNKGIFIPEIVVLYCQHCMAKDAEMKETQHAIPGFKAQFMMMPCSSKVETSHILKILSDGADGVQVIGCKSENCRFLFGEKVVEKRIEHTRNLLREILMGEDRLGMDRGECLSTDELMDLAGNRAEAVRSLGPNPVKRAVI